MNRHIWLWLGTLFLLPVLLTVFVSCSSDDQEEEPMLSIYVYAPERPAVTRGEIVPSEEEGKIHNLQIWVYRSSDPTKMVASLTLTREADLQDLNEHKSASYNIALSDRSFAQSPEPVDVYVLANVLNNNGTNTLQSIVSSEDLDAAVFNGGDFYSFWSSTTHQALTTVPSDKGIPMSGVARGKSVIDRNNVLHINDANVKLLRTVSKIRFVFSSLKGEKRLYLDGVELNKGMMYPKVRFFLDDAHPHYWVQGTPSVDPVRLIESDKVNPVAQNENPADYAFSSSMTDTEYEAKIDEWLAMGESSPLTTKAPVYLPESDKRLTGTIYYRLGLDDPVRRSASFSMVSGDFRRNQTWIVYAYYTGSSKLEVSTVKVTDWEDGGETDHDLHNW